MRRDAIGGVAADKAGRDEDGALGQVADIFADEAKQGDGGDVAHFDKRLTDGGEGGADGRGAGDIVKTDDGDVAGDMEAGLVERVDGADG